MADGKKGFELDMNMEEVLASLAEFEAKYVNQHLLRGLVKTMNRYVKPALKAEYRKNEVTGALTASPGTKGILYKDKGTAFAVTGARTNRRVVKRLKKDREGFVHKQQADVFQRKSLTMDKIEKAAFRRPPREGGGQATRILEKKSKRGKTTRSVYVRRDPSRYAHLLEHSHKAFGLFMTRSYFSLSKAYSSTNSSARAALMREMHNRLTKAAAAASEKSK